MLSSKNSTKKSKKGVTVRGSAPNTVEKVSAGQSKKATPSLLPIRNVAKHLPGGVANAVNLALSWPTRKCFFSLHDGDSYFCSFVWLYYFVPHFINFGKFVE